MTQEEKEYKEMKRLARLWVAGKATTNQRLRHTALSRKIYSPDGKPYADSDQFLID